MLKLKTISENVVILRNRQKISEYRYAKNFLFSLQKVINKALISKF